MSKRRPISQGIANLSRFLLSSLFSLACLLPMTFMWLSNLLKLTLHSEGFSRNASHAVNWKSTFAYLSLKSEWFLFNANSEIFPLFHGENKLIFNEMMMTVRFVLDQHAEFFTCRCTWTIYSDSEPTSLFFLLNAVCLAENQLNSRWFDPTGVRTHDLRLRWLCLNRHLRQ